MILKKQPLLVFNQSDIVFSKYINMKICVNLRWQFVSTLRKKKTLLHNFFNVQTRDNFEVFRFIDLCSALGKIGTCRKYKT